MHATKLAFALILILKCSVAETRFREMDLPEDEFFWGRGLAFESLSMSVPTNPPVTPVTPPTPAPEKCTLNVKLTCTVGEGIDCSAYIPSPDSCLQNVVYASTFENTGSIPFDITVAESQFGSQDPVSILPFLNSTKLSAGEATSYFQENQVNFCVDQVLTYFVRGQATPGACQDEEKYVITTKAPSTLAPVVPQTTPPALPPVQPPTLAPVVPQTTPPALPPLQPPTPAPVVPQTPPPVEPLVPQTPPPVAPQCALNVTITCTVGEGIECDTFIPTGACGLTTQNYVYIFQNTGATSFNIDSYELQRTGQPTTTVNFEASLEPGGLARTFDDIDFDSCVPSETTVTAVGNPGGCVGTDTLSYTPAAPARRRLTRYTRGSKL